MDCDVVNSGSLGWSPGRSLLKSAEQLEAKIGAVAVCRLLRGAEAFGGSLLHFAKGC